MAYSGRINYINLADAVETRIKQAVQYDEIVNDLTVTSDRTVPSSELLKVISDKVDSMSSTSVTVDGTVNNVYDLPPAIDNTGKVYVVNGEVFISDGTEWQQQGAIKGDKGEKGDKGDGLHLSGSALTLEELPSPNTDGATYLINGKVYVYNSEQNTYVDNGLIRGEKGDQGDVGETGLKGDKGEKGDTGKSAYELAVENGFVGTEQEWLDFLKSEGVALPISSNDITETAVRQFISPTLKNKITRNEEDITALSTVLDGFNAVITNGKLTDETIKFDALDTAGYLTDKIDGITIVRSGNKLVAKSIQGVTVDFKQINLLSGATLNIQEQLNSLSKVVSVHSIVNTKADLPAIVLETGSTVLVRQDEDYANASTFYVSNGTVWEYAGKINADLARDFTLEPLDIVTETTGILPKTRYEQQNALEVEFNGVNAEFISTNTQDAIKESKSFAEDGINTLTTNLAITNSNLAGVSGELQITKDNLSNNEVLATEAKKTAQQAYQSVISHAQINATTTGKGHVQIGTGLDVKNGLASIPIIEYSNKIMFLSSPLSDFPNGTVKVAEPATVASGDSATAYAENIALVNSLLGTAFTPTNYTFTFEKETVRSNLFGLQKLHVYINDIASRTKVFELNRGWSSSESIWLAWTVNIMTISCEGSPEGKLLGVKGCLARDINNGNLYRMSADNNTTSTVGWRQVTVDSSAKQYLHLFNNSQQTINSSNQRINFNSKSNGNIPNNPSRGSFTLTGGKVYRITCSLAPEHNPANGNNSFGYRLAAFSGAGLGSVYGRTTSGGSTSSSSSGILDIIYAPPAGQEVECIITSVNYYGTNGASLRAGYGSLVIQEL